MEDNVDNTNPMHYETLRFRATTGPQMLKGDGRKKNSDVSRMSKQRNAAKNKGSHFQ
jgi:hypothetical protein